MALPCFSLPLGVCCEREEFLVQQLSEELESSLQVSSNYMPAHNEEDDAYIVAKELIISNSAKKS